VRLTSQDRRMLEGDYGEGAAIAMQVLVGIGEAFDAPHLVDVSRTHVALSNQDGDRWFAEKLADAGAVSRVPPTVNPGFNVAYFKSRYDLDQQAAEEMRRTHDAYRRLGARLTYNCTPYLELNIPRQGEIVAFSESSATPYVNSVWGARSNRESAQSALCSAITGRTPLYGLLLDENRAGQVVVDVRGQLVDEFDYHLLGWYVAKRIGSHVPVFTGIPRDVSPESLMNLGAELNTAGACPMYHIVGVTPEAPTLDAALGGKPAIDRILVTEDDLRSQREELSEPSGRIEFAMLGCPHLTLAQLSKIAATIKGRHFAVEFFVLTSFATREQARRMGLLDQVERAGGQVVADTCPDQPCWRHLMGKRGVTDSLKCSYYTRRRAQSYVLRSVQDCVEAAIRGEA